MALRPAKQRGVVVLAGPTHGHWGAAAALGHHGVAPGLGWGVTLQRKKRAYK